MPTARDIKRRINSVKNTQQITKAMKMVSGSKLRKAQSAALAVRPYTRRIEDMLTQVGACENLPYLQPRPEIRRVVYVVLGSDRGLCGGFNGNLHRFCDQVLRDEEHPYGLLIVGGKAKDYLTRQGYPVDGSYTELGDNPSFQGAQELARELLTAYDQGRVDLVYLIYSRFINPMSQTPMVRQLLPVVMPEVDEEVCENMIGYIYEPSREQVLAALLPQYVDMGVYAALQEAKASEHGARMTAMSSATNNAAEMIERLTLSLNRARQTAITTEIIEIVGGATALEHQAY